MQSQSLFMFLCQSHPPVQITHASFMKKSNMYEASVPYRITGTSRFLKNQIPRKICWPHSSSSVEEWTVPYRI